jgi:nicotinamidase-related amidase
MIAFNHSLPTLVVIDMQPGFRAANDKATIAAVKREILAAVDDNCPIVIVEFYGPAPNDKFGDTHDELMQALADYSRAARVIKASTGGGEAVRNTCHQNQFGTSLFRVCGVNTAACVAHTGDELREIFYECHVEVAADACNDYDGYTAQEVFNGLERVHICVT